ncbi:ABC transporter ATP-binding protein [Vallicoccus soli]|uniref:ABC transporter ATP-binding protein n=1 Tax=Vallicoccus soli TaxID=2339232 RepID=A0A3A3YXE6_9ACTN|nr:ABC transporter ATP-binding protein [Vallicoccus soli]RJK95455.1 ABC transporter ATP-binding protein [Vallicoccus soli]
MATLAGRLTPEPRSGAPGPAVRARALSRGYGGRVVLDRLDLDVAPGEFVALLGRSGSGKSTLLRALARLDDDTPGSGDLDVPGRRAVVFQDARLLPWARVLDNVVLGLPGAGARARGAAALDEVGLGGRERAWPGELSGGEQQRVALARSLVRDPALLLADEPFGALDALTRLRMHALLRELCARHRPAVVLVTHDVDEAVALADRVLVVDEGRIVLDRPAGTDAAALRADLLGALGVEAPHHPVPVPTRPGGTP